MALREGDDNGQCQTVDKNKDSYTAGTDLSCEKVAVHIEADCYIGRGMVKQETN